MRRSTPKDQVDPAAALMREVGAQLRQVRLERGEDLDTVAQYLRIRSAYLSCIEEGDLSTLPGRTYALGFLRSYADHLGLDGQDLVTQIKSAVGNLTRKQRLRIHTPMPESRLPKTPILAISLVLILAIYGAWTYVGGSGEQVVETVSEVPDDLRRLAVDALAPPPEESEPDAPQSRTEPADATGTGALASVAQAGDASEEQDLEPAAGRTPDEPAAALPAGAPAGTTPGEAQVVAALSTPPAAGEADAPATAAAVTAARVVLRALGISWVHVSSATGDYRYVRILEPGEAFLVPDRQASRSGPAMPAGWRSWSTVGPCRLWARTAGSCATCRLTPKACSPTSRPAPASAWYAERASQPPPLAHVREIPMMQAHHRVARSSSPEPPWSP